MIANTSKEHFDQISSDYDSYKQRHSFYYNNLKSLLSSFIPQKANVLEVGCGTGDLVAHLNPKTGFGIDISPKMIKIAKKKHKNIRFSTIWPKQKFRYIFMSDVIEHLKEPKETFSKISRLMNKDSIFICTMANPLLEPVLIIAEKLKLKMPEGPHNRIKYENLKLMIQESGMIIKKHGHKLLMPIKIPIITPFINKYLEKPLLKFAFIEYFTATKI